MSKSIEKLKNKKLIEDNEYTKKQIIIIIMKLNIYLILK